MNLFNISASLSQKSFLIYHENPDVKSINTINSHNYFIPFDNQEDVFLPRAESAYFELLNDNWSVSKIDNILELKDNFLQNLHQTKINLPFSLKANEFQTCLFPFVQDKIPALIFSKQYINLDADLEKVLCLENISNCFYLYINGTFAGFSKEQNKTCEFDITNLLKTGKNTINILVLPYSDSSYTNFSNDYGIFTDVYILKRIKNHIKDINIQTNLDKSYSTGTINVKIINSNSTLTLLDYNNKKVSSCSAKKDEEIKLVVKKPELWNPENPVYYKLIIKNSNEYIAQKICFTDFVKSSTNYKLNGKKILINSIKYPIPSFTDEYAALKKIKFSNINALSIQNNQSDEFYEYCKELGILVLEDTNKKNEQSYKTLLDYKQIYKPIIVKKTTKNGVFEFTNLMSFTNAQDVFNFSYVITAQGELIYDSSKNDSQWELKPNQTSKIVIPEYPDLSKYICEDLFLRFSFTAKKDFLWCKKDEEVCFEQINLNEQNTLNKKELKFTKINSFLNNELSKVNYISYEGKNTIEPDGLILGKNEIPGFKINVQQKKIEIGVKIKTHKQKDNNIIEKLEDMSFSFDRINACFDSILFANKNILDRPLQFDFSSINEESYTARDNLFSSLENDNQFFVKVFSTEARLISNSKKLDETAVQINVVQAFYYPGKEPFLYGNISYKISQTGKMSVSYSLNYNFKDLIITKIGLKLFTNLQLKNFEYLGFGPQSNFIKNREGVYLGLFKDQIKQNFGATDCRYAKFEFGDYIENLFVNENINNHTNIFTNFYENPKKFGKQNKTYLLYINNETECSSIIPSGKITGELSIKIK